MRSEFLFSNLHFINIMQIVNEHAYGYTYGRMLKRVLLNSHATKHISNDEYMRNMIHPTIALQHIHKAATERNNIDNCKNRTHKFCSTKLCAYILTIASVFTQAFN